MYQWSNPSVYVKSIKSALLFYTTRNASSKDNLAISINNFYPLHSGIHFLEIMDKFIHKLTDIRTSTFIIILFTVAKYWKYQCSSTFLKNISDIHVVENHATSQQWGISIWQGGTVFKIITAKNEKSRKQKIWKEWLVRLDLFLFLMWK